MGWFFVFSRGQNGLEIQLEFKAIRLLCVCLSLFFFSFSIVHPFTTGQFSVSIGVEEKYLKKELAKSED
jgi:hypothetical protein